MHFCNLSCEINNEAAVALGCVAQGSGSASVRFLLACHIGEHTSGCSVLQLSPMAPLPLQGLVLGLHLILR